VKYKLLSQSLGLLLIIAGAIGACFTGTQLVRKIHSERWPWLEARLSSIDYSQYYSSSDAGDKIAELRLSYDYHLNGSTYKSDQIAVGRSRYRRPAEQLAFLEHSRVGDYLKIHYNPSNPGESAVIVGADFIDYVLGIFPVLIGIVGFAIIRFDGFRTPVKNKV
jgi:hypothetical protein